MPQLFGQEYTKKQLLERVGDMTQLASARRAELVEGNERGAELIEVFNASGLCFSILPRTCARYCFRSLSRDVTLLPWQYWRCRPRLLRTAGKWLATWVFWRSSDQLRHDLHGAS